LEPLPSLGASNELTFEFSVQKDAEAQPHGNNSQLDEIANSPKPIQEEELGAVARIEPGT